MGSELTETEYITLKHVLKFNDEKIKRFENIGLSDKDREFIILDMMIHSFESGRKIKIK